MKVIVIYESMYGNTRLVAEAIGAGLAGEAAVEVVPVAHLSAAALDAAELLVVGGPTHVHAMTRPTTRRSAVQAAHKPESTDVLEPDAEGPGLREWFDHLGPTSALGAAFDTRIDMSPALTGRASKGIARRMKHHKMTLVAAPESFLVDKENQLLPGEQERARTWGLQLAAALNVAAPSTR